MTSNMKLWPILLIAALFAVFIETGHATGVHKDDINYQQTVNELVPTLRSVINGLTTGNTGYGSLENIAEGKTILQLCQQFFVDELQVTPNYCDVGQPGETKTSDLQNAGGCLNRIYLQATGVTVNPTDRNCFDLMQKFIQIR